MPQLNNIVSTQQDTAYKQVTIVDGSATTLFSGYLASGEGAGGFIEFLVWATDGTDHQVIAGIACYAAENKAGTIVGSCIYDSANEAKAVSSGTLTLAFSDTDDTGGVYSIKLTPTGSLTETTYFCRFRVRPLMGTIYTA